jgi:uncharacterized protein DUF1707
VLLGDADRELFYERLARHAAAGRLSMDELERRVAMVEAAETREDAAAVLSDLPPLEATESPRAARPRWGRGHGDADKPAPEWHPTNERFRDPRTNRVMRVWVDPDGGRHYVADDYRR